MGDAWLDHNGASDRGRLRVGTGAPSMAEVQPAELNSDGAVDRDDVAETPACVNTRKSTKRSRGSTALYGTGAGRRNRAPAHTAHSRMEAVRFVRL